ncbi:MAG: DUF1330 domain-containing protein [Thermoflexales bacterium]|nr:DUF1330 domain-containing protein [Thermoflexales bacterium]MCX7938568.1 DUF1330 domain-containing protein [Thermoflexales bacterium]MDW8396392.1 DUF1330 domain-containing protein [Anaerolineae bacterium]
MPAYVIADIEVLDPVEYEEYKRLATPTVAQFGGRYIVRGGTVEVIEGDWEPRRVVVIEFPTLEQARAWYHSEAYARARAIRHRTARSRLILVEGLPPTS